MNTFNARAEVTINLRSLGFMQDLKLVKDCVLYLDDLTESSVSSNLLSLLNNVSAVKKSDSAELLFDPTPPSVTTGNKTSFLVFKHQKYSTVPTEDIAFFYIRNEGVSIMRFDGREYCLSQSLLQVAEAVSSRQFYRVNRRYLVNFKAIKEVEHYFNRKLFVKLHVNSPDLLLINKERAQDFLTWLENR
ncbi:LytR/AlgR family response regulator transcription factor [Paraflavitalea pollutisoli]|uniref:LytR/AlgR family response regulator transcription factor n=1 Tax=Paraflavitalea pollutisoli TaxID=3034143 RepID=UPI0023ECE2C2|nr:LytTR family DNA-binding domain-containing protein [Paraflavitalea sp. H1-2-19X]